MRNLCLSLLSTVLICATASPGMCQQYRAGDQVVAIKRVKLTVDGKEVGDSVWPGLTLKVKAVNGEWLWLSNGKPGWVKDENVIPLDRRAIDRLTEMIKSDPKDARLYNGRAVIWSNLGEVDIALGDLNEAIRLQPDASTYYTSRGVFRLRKKDYNAALADFNEAIRRGGDRIARYNRG